MWISHKIKSVKNVIIKKVSYEVFQACSKYTIALFWNLVLVLALPCYCEDNVKYGYNKFTRHEQVCLISLIKHSCSWRIHLLHYEHWTDKLKYFYVKYRLLSKNLLQGKRQFGGWKYLTVTTNLTTKITSSSYHMEQKNIHRSKLHL